MVTRPTAPNNSRAKARAIAAVRDHRLAGIARAIVTGLGALALLLLLTNP